MTIISVRDYENNRWNRNAKQNKKKTEKNKGDKIHLDISKFEKLNEGPTLKREASLKHFLHKFKQKNFFNENEYDKLYPSGSAPVRVYVTLKMLKFSSSDSFPKLRPNVLSKSTCNYNLARFLLRSCFTLSI